jgi:ParB family chromosome partitioning protein
MSTTQTTALNNKHDQLLQRFERDKESRADTNKYANIDQSIGKVAMIPVVDLIIEDNCRKILDTESINFLQLMSSIKKEGILQNLVIEIKREPEFKLVCTSGQRRLIIARILNIEKVPCLIKAQSKHSDSLARSLDENILRENLSPLDLAESYYSLIKEGWNTEQISERYEKDSRTIQYYINMAKFPESAKNIIKENSTLFTVRVLMNEFAKKTWATPTLLIAALKAKIGDGQNVKNKPQDESVLSIEKKLISTTGLKVKLLKNKDNTGGKITFSFKDEKELNKLLEQIN